ncbi:HAMP domain-containing sensor histidine kinase [Alteromonas sp. 14N.309.X.WAT.G.H12]|uniref:HAMP domain-containing sensor histidine kinase n=1 Tax=Alteromonas sp. 14N.309.X.WAT.G.H12 TaxID=3120824 RepID=UPI002FD5893B
MFRTLASQLTLAISALFIIAAFVLFQWYLHSSEKFADEVEQVLHRDLAAHIVHDNPQLESGIIDTESLVSAFHTKMLLGPEWEFYALDTKGKVLAYSAPEGAVKLNSVDLKPIDDYLNGSHFPVYGDDPRALGSQKIFSVTPIISAASSQIQGYLYVIIGGQKRDSATALLTGSKVIKDSAFILGMAILFGIIAMLLVVIIITKPLKKLSQRTLEYVKNDFANLDTTSNSWLKSKEIQDLELSFISSAQHINKQLNQIKNTEQLRRELLSHISHDFKTPMTGLNGYLETWLITPEEQRKPELVHLAYQNSLQINQLVDQLFELARLESGDIQFIPEPVNVVELAYDVMQRLRFQAEQQQVQLRVIAETEHGIVAYADISKLERVLVNLIDNAIRHTQASGMVKIEINDYQDKVAMSIIDNGRGIHQNELEAIFEPKYQASNSQANIANAGLGLSIVKRLLDIHKSVIRVTSQPGKGSRFTFELAKAAL